MGSIARKVTVVSEDSQFLQEIVWDLIHAGYEVQACRSFDPLATSWQSAAPDFLLVDVDHGALASASKLPHLTDHGFTYKILLCNPDRSLERVAELELSFNDAVAKPIKPGELLARLRAGHEFARYEQALREQALCDRCTGLLSRTGFFQNLEAAQQAAFGEQACKFGLIVLSLDLLEELARRFGAAGRDQLLCDAADLIETVVGEQAWLARVGPNAFAAALTGCDIHELEKVAEEVRHQVATREFQLGGETVHLTATLSVATWDALDTSPEDALADAERNLSLARSLGGSTTSWCGQFDDAYAQRAELVTTHSPAANATARDLMTPFAVKIRRAQTDDGSWHALRTSHARVAPVLDECGNYTGIVRENAWQQGVDIAWDAQVETPPEVSDRLAGVELSAHLDDAPDSMVVVMCDREPLGYIAADVLSEVFGPA